MSEPVADISKEDGPPFAASVPSLTPSEEHAHDENAVAAVDQDQSATSAAADDSAGSVEKAIAPASSPNDADLIGTKLPRVRFFLLGLGIGFGLFLSMLDSSIVATSLYSIAIEFKSLDNINWVALAYTLTYLGCAVMFARISDVVGRKAAFMAAYVIFVAFSLGCGFAQNLNELIAFRALQGVGGSGLYSLTMIIFPELTPDNQKKFIAGIIGLVIAVAGVLGPVLGGILTHYASWRWVFWINGPIGFVSFVTFILTWPDKKHLPNIQRRTWKEVDYLGSVLLVAAAVLIVFSFQNAATDTNQWSKAIFIAPLVLGMCCVVALFAWQYTVERLWHGKMAAAFPVELLRNHVYAAGVVNTAFVGFPYLMSVYVFPLRFQVVNGKSALDAGLMLLPMLGATALGSTLGGALNGKKNRIFESLVGACLLMILGCGLETMADSGTSVDAKELGFLAFIGLGFGLSASASTMLAGLESPIHEHAPAQGILAQIRILGGSIGIAASSAILGVKAESELSGVLAPAQLADLAAAASTLTLEQYAAVRKAYTDAFREDMIVCCGVLAVGIFFTLGVYRKNRATIQEQQRLRYVAEGQRRRALQTPAAKPEVASV